MIMPIEQLSDDNVQEPEGIISALSKSDMEKLNMGSPVSIKDQHKYIEARVKDFTHNTTLDIDNVITAIKDMCIKEASCFDSFANSIEIMISQAFAVSNYPHVSVYESLQAFKKLEDLMWPLVSRIRDTFAEGTLPEVTPAIRLDDTGKVNCAFIGTVDGIKELLRVMPVSILPKVMDIEGGNKMIPLSIEQLTEIANHLDPQ